MKTLILVLAAVGLFSGLALAGNAKPVPARPRIPLVGVVVKVSDDAKTVTVKPYVPSAPEVVVAVDDKTVVTVDGKDAKVTDLKAGMRAAVTPAEGTATKIEATSIPEA